MEMLVAILALIQFFVIWRVLAGMRDDIRKIRLTAQLFANEKLQEAQPQASRQPQAEPGFHLSGERS